MVTRLSTHEHLKKEKLFTYAFIGHLSFHGSDLKTWFDNKAK